MKNSVYVLPNTSQASEDFEWLRTEVVALGGQASIFEASSINGVDERQIIEQFRSARAQDFSRLMGDIRALRAKSGRSFRPDEEVVRAIRILRERFQQLRTVDFFAAAGGAKVDEALTKLDADTRRSSRTATRRPQANLNPRDFQHRQWVTRPRPGIDRCASAWLIRRFVDPHAGFLFAASPDKWPDAVPFDMYQPGGFKHEGDLCTFEVLQERFGIKDLAVRRIGEIVRDLDLKDDRFKSAHAPTIGIVVDGLRASITDDPKLLEQGMALFEALYQSLHPAKRPRGKAKIC